MKAFIFVLIAAVIAASSVAAPSDCIGTASIFGDILSGILADTINVEWTVFETPDIRAYRVIRIPAAAAAPTSHGSSRARPTMIADLVPDGEHLWAEHTYALTDTAPKGTWVYRLYVHHSHAASCILETEPLTGQQ